jgi:hypothetical protein
MFHQRTQTDPTPVGAVDRPRRVARSAWLAQGTNGCPDIYKPHLCHAAFGLTAGAAGTRTNLQTESRWVLVMLIPKPIQEALRLAPGTQLLL